MRRYGEPIDVRKIITSVIEALSKDSARKFVYVEQVYFQMWWNEQTPKVRDLVRQLVKGEFFGNASASQRSSLQPTPALTSCFQVVSSTLLMVDG